MANAAVKVIQEEGHLPKFVREDNMIWATDFPTSARHLGKQVADELAVLMPTATDTHVYQVAAKLADQEPPLPTELSWSMYDGVRAAVEDRREREVFAARQRGANL